MNQIIEQLAGKRAGAATAFIVIFCGVFAASLAWPAPIGSAAGSRRVGSQLDQHALQLAAEPATAPVIRTNTPAPAQPGAASVDK